MSAATTPSSTTTRPGQLLLAVALGGVTGVLCGVASALFLWCLDVVTDVRVHDERLVYGLPFAGLALGLVAERYGASIKRGTGLVIDTIHDGGPPIPARLVPFALFGTLIAHLFGASVGREGSAVQMGAGLADGLAQRLHLDDASRRQLVTAGVAGGFGAVFGTPIAGAVFALELVVVGRFKHDALAVALVASLVGDMTTRAIGIEHTRYPAAPVVALTPLLALQWLLFAVVVAVVTIAFIELTHLLKRRSEHHIQRAPLRLFVGGVVIVALWKIVGTSDVLGLGVPTIVRAFHDEQLPVTLFAFKLIVTAVAIGTAWPGGEVTPLFFMGATLGNVLARVLALPIGLGAGVGLAAVFAAAANTPVAIAVMAAELFGAPVLPHAALVCVVAWLLVGRRSIYAAQRRPT